MVAGWCRRDAEREADGRSFVIGFRGGVFEAEAFAGEGEDASVVQEAVENGGGCRDVADEFTPILEGAVGGHERRAIFISAHDDFEEVLSGVFREFLQSHVVDDEKVGLQVLAKEAVLLIKGIVLEKVADEVEDRSVAHEQIALNGFVADCLGEMGLAQSRGPDEEDVGALLDEAAGGQIKELLPLQFWIKAPVKLFEGLQGMKARDVLAAFQVALVADVELILEDEFEELGVAETVGGGLLKPHGEVGAEAGEAELTQCGVEWSHEGKATR